MLYDSDKFSDGELIDKVIEKVWAAYGNLTPQSELIDELVQRFMRYSGLTKTPKGILRVDREEHSPSAVQKL